MIFPKAVIPETLIVRTISAIQRRCRYDQGSPKNGPGADVPVGERCTSPHLRWKDAVEPHKMHVFLYQTMFASRAVLFYPCPCSHPISCGS